MLQALYDVTVPYEKATYKFQVPEYDIPVIKHIWHGKLKAGQVITAVPMGIFRGENLHNAYERMKMDYSAASDADPTQSAWRAIYPKLTDLEKPYRESMEKSEEMHEEMERRRVDNEPDPVEPEKPVPAADIEALKRELADLRDILGKLTAPAIGTPAKGKPKAETVPA